MACPTYLLLFMAIAGPFYICFAESRKELRDKEVYPITVVQSEDAIHLNRVYPSRIVELSWRPRAFLYKGFLTDEECDHLISMAQGTKGTIATKSDDSGEIAKNRMLASSQSFSNVEDKMIKRIEERISAWTLLPKEYSKPLQVSRHAFEETKAKFDYIGNKSMSILREPLMATLILYLSNVTHGGEILFPESELNTKIWSDCSKSSAILRPIKGNAILFFTVHLNASPDKSSSHARCPVLEGEMWCATKFFFMKSVDGAESMVESEASECTDEDPSCPKWAAIGECKKNPVFMVGSPDYYGTCRKSCNAC